MDTDTETIKNSIRGLPKELRDYVTSKTWAQKVTLVEQTNRLTDIQSAALKAEIFLVLVGIENYSDFKTNVQKNVVGVDNQTFKNIVDDAENNIFSDIRQPLLEIEKENDSVTSETHPDKETILNGIENPAPTKPVIVNRAGVNPILDGQNNLPEGERRVEIGNGKPTASSNISSSAVPSRGPMLGNFKSNLDNAPTPPAPKSYSVDPYREPAE